MKKFTDREMKKLIRMANEFDAIYQAKPLVGIGPHKKIHITAEGFDAQFGSDFVVKFPYGADQPHKSNYIGDVEFFYLIRTEVKDNDENTENQ